jgi:pyruvyl transferase EpsO
MADRDPVVSHQTILRDRFAQVFSGRRVSLIGFPRNQNCGDYAEWLGALTLLRELNVELSSAMAWPVNGGERTRPAGHDPIFAVGATFADANAAAAMAELIRAAPGPVVISPQSVADARLLSDFPARPKLTVFARDRNSKDTIERSFGGKFRCDLAPPLAFMLGAQQPKTEPEYDIVWVARTGRSDSGVEAAARLSTQSAEKLDLPNFADRLELDVVVRRRPPTVLLTDWSSLVFRNQEARLAYDALDMTVRAQAYVDRALHILSLGRVIITDRIGAHAFCELLGVAHVLCDHGADTNRAFFDQWSHDSKLCQFADTPAKAWSLARAMLHEIKGEGP